MGRPAKYDWEDKKDICYQLSVVERKTPREIATYFANHFNVPESEIPAPRIFRRQFSTKWNFPRRGHRLKPEDEPVVIDRIRGLWEQNNGVKEILEVLLDEGWDIGEPEYQRLRRRNGFHRRSTFGSFENQESVAMTRKRKAGEQPDTEAAQDGAGEPESTLAEAQPATQQPSLPPEELARRQEHLAKVQFESDQALLTRKRRRRIRGYGHLPADEPGMAPRYDSETTLDECKAYLHLSNEMYQTMRDDYEVICNEMNIERKKTSMESGAWQASKDRLIMENMHLSAMMHPLQPNLDAKTNAVDVICGDVTKRMRDRGKRITMAEANNLLGLNPAASKTIRRSFYDILQQDQYTTRLACGLERWTELRERWFATSPILQQVVAEGEHQKMRAMETLCRDAVKRRNDDRLRENPEHRQYHRKHYGPGPGSVRGTRWADRTKLAEIAAAKAAANLGASGPEGEAAEGEVAEGRVAEASTASAQQEIPARLANQAAAPVTTPIDPALSAPAATATPSPLPTQNPEQLSIPAYFRLSPTSSLTSNHPNLWLAKLTARTMHALHAAALSKAGAEAQVLSVHGVVKNADGSEDEYPIEGDEELDVYITASYPAGTFVVVLMGGEA
ncbi:hypothetical protein LTR86_010834 [Recurvomyces mirabilis]|nr:hypothetical protein LTR86_010834 [Recurvomyces mirabilis]